MNAWGGISAASAGRSSRAPQRTPREGGAPQLAAAALTGFVHRTPRPNPASQFLYRRYEPILPTSLTYIILSLEAANRTDLMRIEYAQA